MQKIFVWQILAWALLLFAPTTGEAILFSSEVALVCLSKIDTRIKLFTEGKLTLGAWPFLVACCSAYFSLYASVFMFFCLLANTIE